MHAFLARPAETSCATFQDRLSKLKSFLDAKMGSERAFATNRSQASKRLDLKSYTSATVRLLSFMGGTNCGDRAFNLAEHHAVAPPGGELVSLFEADEKRA